MTTREPLVWCFRNLKARHSLYGLIITFAMLGIVGHDLSLLMARDRGDLPVNPTAGPILPVHTVMEARIAGALVLGAMVILAAFAILTRIGQWHYLNHGVSVD